MGDFNLDARMQYRNDYPHKHVYDVINEFTTRHQYVQNINFTTWSRSINNVKKESILDHVYTKDLNLLDKCFTFNPCFGDHLPVVMELEHIITKQPPILRRNWQSYTPAKLCNLLSQTNLIFENDTVQEYWNSLENVLINATDQLAPITLIKTNESNQNVPLHIKAKLNKRNRLLKNKNIATRPEISNLIKTLNKEIRLHFYKTKSKRVKNLTCSNVNTGLWKAVRLVKNQNTNDIPCNLKLNGVNIDVHNTANAFAGFFHDKIENIQSNTTISRNVYNGKNKLIVDSRFFMGETDILECMKTLKPKMCEGYDRIPLIILCDARDILLPSLTLLFHKVYSQNDIPDQWRISKILPIHKKGSKNNIENYRPVANLCSITKLFE